MKSMAEVERTQMIAFSLFHQEVAFMSAVPLADEHRQEVLAFLGERPAHTFGMIGFIRANGLVSPHNRGQFYGCRDAQGCLVGVALIGHALLLESESEAAIAAFARIAQSCSNAHILLGEQEKVELFWHYYAEGGQAARLYCRELLFELRWPIEIREAVPELRPANLDDLDSIAPVHAQIAFEESGINPLEVDSEGFRQRCARRIQQGRTWVWMENEKILFKAEVVTDSPEVIYLEGVWVNPEERGKGIGLRCMSQLAAELLQRTSSICLLVNEKNQAAQALYEKVGYRLISQYETVFLKQETH